MHLVFNIYCKTLICNLTFILLIEIHITCKPSQYLSKISFVYINMIFFLKILNLAKYYQYWLSS